MPGVNNPKKFRTLDLNYKSHRPLVLVKMFIGRQEKVPKSSRKSGMLLGIAFQSAIKLNNEE